MPRLLRLWFEIFKQIQSLNKDDATTSVLLKSKVLVFETQNRNKKRQRCIRQNNKHKKFYICPPLLSQVFVSFYIYVYALTWLIILSSKVIRSFIQCQIHKWYKIYSLWFYRFFRDLLLFALVGNGILTVFSSQIGP